DSSGSRRRRCSRCVKGVGIGRGSSGHLRLLYILPDKRPRGTRVFLAAQGSLLLPGAERLAIVPPFLSRLLFGASARPCPASWWWVPPCCCWRWRAVRRLT